MKNVKSVTCHFDRKHYAKGLCKQCYEKGKEQNRPTRSGSRPSKEYLQKYYQDTKERQRTRAKAKYAEHPETVKAYSLIKLGWTWEAYNKAFEEQQGLCEICKEPENIIRRGKVQSLSADHAHEAVPRRRGLLCARCNYGLGNFKDSPMRLSNAIAYLEKYAKEDTNVRALFAVV